MSSHSRNGHYTRAVRFTDFDMSPALPLRPVSTAHARGIIDDVNHALDCNAQTRVAQTVPVPALNFPGDRDAFDNGWILTAVHEVPWTCTGSVLARPVVHLTGAPLDEYATNARFRVVMQSTRAALRAVAAPAQRVLTSEVLTEPGVAISDWSPWTAEELAKAQRVGDYTVNTFGAELAMVRFAVWCRPTFIEPTFFPGAIVLSLMIREVME